MSHSTGYLMLRPKQGPHLGALAMELEVISISVSRVAVGLCKEVNDARLLGKCAESLADDALQHKILGISRHQTSFSNTFCEFHIL